MQNPSHGGPNGRGEGGFLNKEQPPRNNRLVHTGLGLDVFLMPSLTGSLLVAYADLDSPLDMESYKQIQVGIALIWGPVEFYGQVQLQDGESPPDYESYTRQVVQCGLSWFF
jgi:hypothetical protein